jgi:hypothetical protein
MRLSHQALRALSNHALRDPSFARLLRVSPSRAIDQAGYLTQSERQAARALGPRLFRIAMIAQQGVGASSAVGDASVAAPGLHPDELRAALAGEVQSGLAYPHPMSSACKPPPNPCWPTDYTQGCTKINTTNGCKNCTGTGDWCCVPTIWLMDPLPGGRGPVGPGSLGGVTRGRLR